VLHLAATVAGLARDRAAAGCGAVSASTFHASGAWKGVSDDSTAAGSLVVAAGASVVIAGPVG